MSGIISHLCSAFTSCWYPRDTDTKTEITIERSTAPQENSTTDGERAQTAGEHCCDIDTNIIDKPLDESVEDDSPEDEIADEGHVHQDIPSIAVNTNPFVHPMTSPGVDLDNNTSRDGMLHEQSSSATKSLRQSIMSGIDDEKLARDLATREMVEQEVAARTDEMTQLIKKAEVSGPRELEDLNNELLAWFSEPYLAKLLQQEELGNMPRAAKRADYLLISPRRFTGQNEIIGTISFWMHTSGDQVCVNEFVLAFEHLHSASKDSALVTAGDLDLQRAFNEFRAMAEKARKPTLAMLNAKNHWIGIVADTRGDTPVYYICDTNAPAKNKRNEEKVNGYLNKLEQFSGGQINRSNTVYCGYPMQQGTSNACGPLACWIQERTMEKLKTEPTRRIDELFQECYREWRDIRNDSRELEREFARRLRALMFARMGAWSTANRLALPTGATRTNAIIYA